MRTAQWFAAALLVMALACGAGAQTTTLQRDLNAYNGVTDLSLEGHGNGDMRPIRWANLGARTTLYCWGTTGRTFMIRFADLAASLPGGTTSADIQSAVVSICRSNTASTGATTLYKLQRSWVEGTGGAVGTAPWHYPDYDAVVDGSCSYYSTLPTQFATDNWFYQGISDIGHVWSRDMTGVTIDHVQYNKSANADSADWFDIGGWVADPDNGWLQVANWAEMTSNGRSRDWYISGSTVYVEHDGADAGTNPAQATDGCTYYTDTDAWEAMCATGDADIDKGDPVALGDLVGEWRSADITQWVKDWLDTPSANYGMQFQSGSEGFYFSSEYADDTSLRPKLEITIPEPATLALLGLGFAGLAALRRRRK